MEPNEGAPQEVNSVLSIYEQCSGKMINKDKSSILFSKNTDEGRKNTMKRIMDVEGLTGKYLGRPTCIGKGKEKNFHHIREKVWKKYTRMEGEILDKSREGNIDKSISTCNYSV